MNILGTDLKCEETLKQIVLNLQIKMRKVPNKLHGKECVTKIIKTKLRHFTSK